MKLVRSLNQLIEVLSSNWQMLLNYYALLTEELRRARSGSDEHVEKAVEEQLRRLQYLKVEIENYYGEFDVSYFCEDFYQVLVAQTLEENWVQAPLHRNLQRRLGLLDTLITQRRDEYNERRDRELAERQSYLNDILFTLTIFAFVGATATIVATVDYQPGSIAFHWGRFWLIWALTVPLLFLAIISRQTWNWLRRRWGRTA
jgi:hypothetical protein